MQFHVFTRENPEAFPLRSTFSACRFLILGQSTHLKVNGGNFFVVVEVVWAVPAETGKTHDAFFFIVPCRNQLTSRHNLTDFLSCVDTDHDSDVWNQVNPDTAPAKL